MSTLYIQEPDGLWHASDAPMVEAYDPNFHRRLDPPKQVFIDCKLCGYRQGYYGETEDILCGKHYHQLLYGKDEYGRPPGAWVSTEWAASERARLMKENEE